MDNEKKTVVILGASNKPDRYSYRALRLLLEKGYNCIPIHPALDYIDEIKVTHSLSDVKEKVHTLTLYVNPSKIESQLDAILDLKPERVIFNPGTESSIAETRLKENGIPALEACTLVMLKTGVF